MQDNPHMTPEANALARRVQERLYVKTQGDSSMLPQFDLPEQAQQQCAGRGDSMTCPTRPLFQVGPPEGAVLACERHLAMILSRVTPLGHSLVVTRLALPDLPAFTLPGVTAQAAGLA